MGYVINQKKKRTKDRERIVGKSLLNKNKLNSQSGSNRDSIDNGSPVNTSSNSNSKILKNNENGNSNENINEGDNTVMCEQHTVKNPEKHKPENGINGNDQATQRKRPKLNDN